MNYNNRLNKIEKKLIFTLFLLLMTSVPLFCQENNKGYRVHYKYTTDSTGKSIIKTGLEYQIISNDSWYGIIDSSGNIIIPLGKYSFLNPIDEKGMILAKKGGKEGFIDINENILIPFIYDELGIFSDCDSLAPAAKNKKQGFINRKGETIIPFEYDYNYRVGYFYEPGIAVLVKNGKYGVINAENKIVIPFIYDDIDFSSYRKNDYVVAWKQEQWACFSTDGKQLSDFCDYKILDGASLSHLPTNCKNLPMLVTTKENERLLTELHDRNVYRNATKKTEQFMEAQLGISYAYLDKYLTMIVPFGVYDYADVFRLGRKAIVANKGKYGIINEYGELLLPLEFDFIEQPSLYGSYAKYFVATKGDTVLLFDENVNIIPTADIASYLDREASLIVSNRENKKGRIDYTGKQTIPFLYDTLYKYNIHGYYIAKKDGFYGSISDHNEIIQAFQYKYIYAISNNLAYVNNEYKIGVFDKDGNLTIPFEYDGIYDTYYDYSDYKKLFPNAKNIYIVEKNGKIGTIDDKNNIIIPIIYDGLSSWVEYGPDAHFAKKNGKYGIISYKGEIIIPIEYDYVGIPQNEIIKVRKNGKYGVISWKDKVILSCIYDYLILDIPWSSYGYERQNALIYALHQNTWKCFDCKGNLLQSNVHPSVIKGKYGDMLNRGEPSNESYDFNIIQKGEIKSRNKL